MAVYTNVTLDEVKACLKQYSIGDLLSLEGIAQGVENSNFLLKTTDNTYILTLYEKRVKAEELPWYLDLMTHLTDKGISCPVPVAAQDGTVLQKIAGRPAAIVTFLLGKETKEITPDQCFAVGQAMAKLHEAGQDFNQNRTNNMGVQSWEPLLNKSAGHGHDDIISEVRPILEQVLKNWPSLDQLPVGQIHGDLFPDNVFFLKDQLSGIIDFYFACTDFLAFDVAIAINAWCFTEKGQFIPIRSEQLLAGYQSVRPFTEQEKAFFPILLTGASIRFFLSRLYDWINTPPDALVVPKDPKAYLYRIRFHHVAQENRL